MDKEESQESNMSMEDILSSIKGILSENEKQSPVQSAKPQEDAEKPEEVYDLSASMIFDEHKPAPKSELEEIKDAEFSIDDISLPEVNNMPEDLPEIELTSPQMNMSSDPIFDAEEDSRHLDEISTLTSAPAEQEENSISDEALDELIHSIDENNSDEILEKEIPSSNITSVDDILLKIPTPEAEVSDEEIIQPMQPALEVEKAIEFPKELKSEEVEEKEEPKSENKQDVPEEIIDNFAAMFNSNNTEGTTVASVDSSKKIGDGAQTVEDLIKAVLRESLKPSIEDAMTKIDEDMLVEAKAAVEVEAKAWVNKNLTRVVEEIVREEVRRVMAKVGS